jgi:hypothetical protein
LDKVNHYNPESPFIFTVDKYQEIRQEIRGFPIQIEVKKEKLKRLVEVSSTVLLQNNTSLPLEFVIFDQQGVHETKSIQNQFTKAPIAFDNIRKTLMLSMKSSVSQKVELTKVLTYKEGSFKIPFVCPRGNYNNLKMEISQKSGITFLTVKPALKIVNFCPEPIQYTLKQDHSEDSNIIFRNKPIEIYRFDPYIEYSTLEVTLNDVFSSTINLGKLLAKNGITSVKLVSFESRTRKPEREEDEDPDRKIYLEFFNDTANNTLIIYSKFNIFNETGLSLNFYSFKTSGMSKPRKSVENGNKNTIFMASRAHDTIILKPTLKTFENSPGVTQIKPSERGGFPKKLNCTLNQAIKGGQGKGQYELNIVVIPNVIEISPNILTKTITIVPKYVFVNSTDYQVCVIQLQCNVIHKVPPKGRQAMIWRSNEKQVSFQVDDEEMSL